VKFTGQGSIILRVEREHVDPHPAGAASWLRFSVADTGIGIAADKTQMIFESFTQADSSTTRQYGGTGLGLAISKGLVELMGGRIACISEIGRGSTFSFTAPFEICKVMQITKSAEPAVVVFPKAELAVKQPITRILIAEDSEDNLVLTKAYLKDCGFTLDIADNGRIAVEKAISGNPHLVLMDLQMPVMDGLQATRAIREWEAETHAHPMPILALTAHATEEAVSQSMAAGCTEHLTKPIKKATLLEAISRHIAGIIRITPPAGVESRVPKYLANIRRDMDAILADADSKDCSTARRLGHQFKGTGEGYGFPEIARAGAAVELAAIAANQGEICNQIRALAAYLDRVEVVV
jgi:CheY-like chemotaxis protein